MIKNFYFKSSFLILIYFFFPFYWAASQTNLQEELPPINIFEALSVKTKNSGIIKIQQSLEVRKLVGTAAKKSGIFEDGDILVSIVPGFRIQAFTGNLSSSQKKAYERANLVYENFPELACYISYKAPFWYLVVGDFKTKVQAEVQLKEMKKKLPTLSRELYIVKDKIRAID